MTTPLIGGPNDGKTTSSECRAIVYPWMVTRNSVTFPADGIFRQISTCAARYELRKRADTGAYEYHYAGMESEPCVEWYAGIDEDGCGVYVFEMTLRDWDKLHPPGEGEDWPFCYEEGVKP